MRQCPMLLMKAAVLAAGLASCTAPLFAQEPTALSLQQAVTIALEKNPLRKAAIADTEAASAGVREARSSLFPHLTFSETAMLGNDPVYVFGSKLRRQRFTVADFSLNKLNTPTPFGDFDTSLGARWNLFDSFVSWRGVKRAKLANQATACQLDRTDQEIVYQVVEAYYAVLLAGKQVEVDEHALKTTQSIMDRSQARFDSGVAVESDLLSAKVRLAGRQQHLIRAKNNFSLAQTQLNTAMGISADSSFKITEPASDRSPPTPILEDLEKQALIHRPDLKRVELEEQAQQQSVSIAKSSFGPRVNAFAGWDLHKPTLFAGGGGNDWVGGIEVQFDIFQGGAKRAHLSRERALQDKVAAMKQAATDAVRLEVRRAYYDFDANRQQLEVARAAISQAQESLRMNQDRYDGGLTTITDLLGTEDAAQRTQTDYWQAMYRLQTSYANLELAAGTLNPQSPVVTP
ncbi:MAG TPA: TolC family protein [Terriglobales bacterium]|nr:TolC family protein [Terriglobales bacterium]